MSRELHLVWGKIFLAAVSLQRLAEEYPGDLPPGFPFNFLK